MTTNTTPAVRELSDYPAIKKLALALHRLDASHHGAAIMIGAGFSRSAARHVDGQKKVRLWSHFTRSLARDLNANEQELSFIDPLRVAEEYRAYFGQAALNDRIRFEIENEAWRTGPLYRALLELPWSEVLTTNWDTLLEQAAAEIHNPYYTPVTKTPDLAWAQSPRIVKLHGTIGITETFIAALEDYRTYPEQFAPFVNLARQVFIENELCLLGFSGDDPNFLQWAGWVRDHLAGHARKIYLVGALNLSAARRKQLESINVAPVDLWPVVAHISDADLRHQTAIELFLQAMADEARRRIKPHEWQPASLNSTPASAEDHTRVYRDAEYGATVFAGKLDALRRDRESYPGWLVCPRSLRWQLVSQLHAPFPNPKNLAALTHDDRAKLLYEIAWRYRVTLEYIDPWLSDALLEVANPEQPCALSKRQQLEIALVVLNNARWTYASSEREQQAVEEHARILIGILEKYAPYLPDCAAEVAYQRSLVARDRLDYDGLAANVGSVVGEDPIWKLRQAALLMDLGRSEEASRLVAHAYGELRDNHRRDRQSIPILSRLLWAHWLLEATRRGNFGQMIDELPAFAERNYQRWKCDPWSWLRELSDRVEKRRETHLEGQSPIEPLFQQGHYRDRSNDISMNCDISDFLLLDGLSRTVGIPLRFKSSSFDVGLLASDAEAIALHGGTGDPLRDCTLAIRSARSEDSKAIKGLFTRLGVACASEGLVNTLMTRAQLAVAYWRREREQGSAELRLSALSMLRVFLEILARLAIRVSPAQAKELFVLAASLGKRAEMQQHWLFEVIGDLLTNSLTSVPESEQGELLRFALDFPLQSEVVNGDIRPWPNPVIDHPSSRGSAPTMGARIAQLILAVESNSGKSRSAPLLRLLPLSTKTDFLSQEERERLAAALWGEAPEYQALPETGLLPHALLLLPVRDAARAEALIRAHLYDHGAEVLENTQGELRSYPSPEIELAIAIYEGIANAAGNEALRLLPTSEQALVLFDRLVAWRPPALKKGPLQLNSNSRKHLAESIGRALSYAIAPTLAYDQKTDSRLNQLKAFYSEVEGARTALPAFAYFACMSEQSAKTASRIIRAALRSRDTIAVSYAAIALQKWIELPDSVLSAEFGNLTSTVIAIIESGRPVGLPHLTWLARDLLNSERLSDDQREKLIEVVPEIFKVADYINIEPSSREAVSASTVRAECVRLAQTLQRHFPNDTGLKELLSKSQSDPLPEVRFALNSTQ